MNLDLPLFDLSPCELEACLEDLDQALDAAFLSDLEAAVTRASSASASDAPIQAQESPAA